MLNIEKFKEQVGCNIPATEAQIRICNLKLRQNNLPEIPTDFSKVLEVCNGFSNEDTSIFGAEIKNNNWYTDIAEFNISYFQGEPAKWLILGESDFFFLVYDELQSKYYVADRDTFDEEFSTEDVSSPLEYMLKIE